MGLISLGETVGSSTGVAVTSNASADTFGSWGQLKSSTAARVDAVHLTIIPTTGSGRNFILELGTGASSSETTLVAIPVYVPSTSKEMRIMLPLTIPSGTRVAARCKDSTGSGVLRVTATGQEQTSLLTQGATSGTLLNTITGSNGFTALDTGGTANTFVSATINASTSADYNTFVVIFRDASTGAAANALLKLKDDGTEFAAHFYKRLTNNDGNISTVGPFFHSVASGSSVTVEGESDSTTINDLTVAVIGFNLTASGGSSVVSLGDIMNTTSFAAGATSKSVEVIATTISTGLPKTDLVYNTSGLAATYNRGATGTDTSITLATQTSTGAWSSGGFVHKGKGVYRLDVPDAALASGADWVTFKLDGVSDCRISVARVELTGGDPRSATVDANVVKINDVDVIGAGTSGDKWRA
ncbi:hypothetical protein [Caudoviricetes sp.]|nr:hypothetical protein [Caudoviricetes sp.]